MSDITLLVLIEAGQVRSLVGTSLQVPLPDALIWGASVLPEIEQTANETSVWPSEGQLSCAIVLDRDARRIVRAGASHSFNTPYQLVLFERMLTAVWDYQVEQVTLSHEEIARAAGIDCLPVDPHFARRIWASLHDEEGDVDSDEDEDSGDDFDGYDDGIGEDFRQLTTTSVANVENDIYQQVEDHNWLVSVREQGDLFRHYRGDYVMQTLCDVGPDVIASFAELNETNVPNENATSRGIIIDLITTSVTVWSHPRGVNRCGELQSAWPGWTIDQWHSNGYRRHLDATDESERTVITSDLRVLAGFVPALAERFDLNELVGQVKSSVRGCVFRAYGCLAIVLAIPALLAWAATGGWRGPFAFAGGLWMIAFVAYVAFSSKMKRNFASMIEQGSDMSAKFRPLGPDEKGERIRHADEALKAAGLPGYQQVKQESERLGED